MLNLVDSMQLLDELPMIWTASILLYASLSRSVAYPARFSIALTAATVGITVFYLYVANPEILFISFGVLLVAVLIVNLLKKTSKSSDNEVVSKMKWVGIPMLVFGFVCWMVDRHFCDTLQAWREAIGQPWATLLELHGWW
jgi:dihydroceramidase